MRFPEVIGSNLLKQDVTLPNDLKSKYKILIVAFQQWHQRLVNSWIPLLESIAEENSSFDYFEIPTIRRMNWLYQRMIDGGMRSGIPSPETRRRTITLYIDKTPFKDALKIPSEESIHVFLLDSEGEVIWREEGEIGEAKANSLISKLEEVGLKSSLSS